MAEADAFFARWPDSYVADRGRNDWLLELGRRQDWETFLRIQPQFRMADDREVNCLGVCPRGAITVVNGAASRDWLLVRPGADLDALAAALDLPAQAEAQNPG